FGALVIGAALPGGLLLALVLSPCGDGAGDRTAGGSREVQVSGDDCMDVYAERNHPLQFFGEPDQSVGVPDDDGFGLRLEQRLESGPQLAVRGADVVVGDDLAHVPTAFRAELAAGPNLPFHAELVGVSVHAQA